MGLSLSFCGFIERSEGRARIFVEKTGWPTAVRRIGNFNTGRVCSNLGRTEGPSASSRRTSAE